MTIQRRLQPIAPGHAVVHCAGGAAAGALAGGVGAGDSSSVQCTVLPAAEHWNSRPRHVACQEIRVLFAIAISLGGQPTYPALSCCSCDEQPLVAREPNKRSARLMECERMTADITRSCLRTRRA